MKSILITGLLGLGVSLCGCVSVFEGTSQKIDVVTNPTDAICVFERLGLPIGTVAATPGFLTVRKSKDDITVKCDKPGYQQAVYLNHSGTSATIAANVAIDLILTAGISSIVDSANGADNKYDSVVNLSLIPVGVIPATAAAGNPGPPSAVPASVAVPSVVSPPAATVATKPNEK